MAAFYRATFADFLDDSPEKILGLLLRSYQHNELQKQQTKAWEIEIKILKSSCNEIIQSVPSAAGWSLLLEYPIPRRSKRLDAVLLAADLIFCLEFKTRDKTHSLQAERQVEDYALDIRDFHEASRNRCIVPVTVIPKAQQAEKADKEISTDSVREVKRANESDLATVILRAFEIEHRPDGVPIDPSGWDKSPYHPVPTIIEAAEALFAGHNVREIAHSHAEAKNLTVTSDRLLEIIRQAQQNAQKVICFVTGIPGAGKTLAGLNVIHNPSLRRDGRPAGVFLSGNGPLVKIVSAALSRDHMSEIRDFPFALTRSLETTRTWLRQRARGQQRAGLVASSGAIRLRSDGLELSSGFRQGNRDMFVNWFLNLPPDVRSSNQLEVAASEFECQGLELDWVGLCWGGDFSFDPAGNLWTYRNFAGTRWGILKNEIDRQYLLNTYRVLLTRARRGMIIWVPQGDSSDQTRLPSFFDSTAEYLLRCGVPLI